MATKTFEVKTKNKKFLVEERTRWLTGKSWYLVEGKKRYKIHALFECKSAACILFKKWARGDNAAKVLFEQNKPNINDLKGKCIAYSDGRDFDDKGKRFITGEVKSIKEA